MARSSELARAFHSTHPSHGRAIEARKIEAICAVRGAEGAPNEYIEAAIALASSFRSDPKFSLIDRVEVALAADRLELGRRTKYGAVRGRIPAVLELANRLRGEFGEQPLIDEFLLDFARTAPSSTGLKIATHIAGSTKAVSAAKAQAQVIIDRAALSGKRVTLTVKTIDGAEVGLPKQGGQPQLLVVWRPSEAGALFRA